MLQTHMSVSAVVTSGAGTAYPSGAPEFTPVVSGIHGPQYVAFCGSLLIGLFLLAIVLYVLLRLTSSG